MLNSITKTYTYNFTAPKGKMFCSNKIIDSDNLFDDEEIETVQLVLGGKGMKFSSIAHYELDSGQWEELLTCLLTNDASEE